MGACKSRQIWGKFCDELKRKKGRREESVGGDCPPRAPMGPEPLCLSGEGAEGAQRADRGDAHTQTHRDFTQLRAARMRKTLLLLSLYWVGELGSLKN